MVPTTSYIPHVASIVMVEAYAMWDDLAFAGKSGYNNVVAESGTLEVIQACTCDLSWWSESAAVLLFVWI